MYSACFCWASSTENTPDGWRITLDRFPGWIVQEDVYLVRYHKDKGVNKTYKVTLVNGDKTLKLKLDEKGNFL